MSSTDLNAHVYILCLGFTLDCTKNKELKWSQTILPKKKEKPNMARSKKEKRDQMGAKRDHFKTKPTRP